MWKKIKKRKKKENFPSKKTCKSHPLLDVGEGKDA